MKALETPEEKRARRLAKKVVVVTENTSVFGQFSKQITISAKVLLTASTIQ
jgi:hypothetical protein